MYVRIARFEGVDFGRIDEHLEMLRRSIDEVRAGGQPEGIPQRALKTLAEDVTRVVELADRENRVRVGLVFSDSADGIARVHEVLDRMSPQEGEGKRASVDVYEVVLDEKMR
jgi:hypothetical protein